jgi:hypothetical protein
MSANIFRFSRDLGRTVRSRVEVLARDETRLFVREANQPGTRIYPLGFGTLVLPAELPIRANREDGPLYIHRSLCLAIPAAWSNQQAAAEIRARNLNPNFLAWHSITRCDRSGEPVPLFPDPPSFGHHS